MSLPPLLTRPGRLGGAGTAQLVSADGGAVALIFSQDGITAANERAESLTTRANFVGSWGADLDAWLRVLLAQEHLSVDRVELGRILADLERARG